MAAPASAYAFGPVAQPLQPVRPPTNAHTRYVILLALKDSERNPDRLLVKNLNL